MTERLDRIDATLDRVAQQQAKNTEGIDNLLAAIAVSESRIQRLVEQGEAADARFKVLRAEASTDRQEFRENFNTLRAEAAADRKEFRAMFNDAIEQMKIDREEAKARADADREEARARAEADRKLANERYAAQMEVTQSLLLELTKSNGNINKLRDRVDTLDQAS